MQPIYITGKLKVLIIYLSHNLCYYQPHIIKHWFSVPEVNCFKFEKSKKYPEYDLSIL